MVRMMSETGWVKVSLEVDALRIEETSAMLWEMGAGGVEIQDDTTFTEHRDPLSQGAARAVAYFSSDDADLIRTTVKSGVEMWNLPCTNLETAPFTDMSWKDKWKLFFKPAQVSTQLAVCPPWEVQDFGEDVHTIVIEPGMAFGTGTHATTRLCLAWINDLVQEKEPGKILDVGCGSGILSIGAAKITQNTQIEALDVDPEALFICKENLETNHVLERIEVRENLLHDVDGSYDLVIANILAHILMELRDDLIRTTEKGGKLLLCGIGTHDGDKLRDHFTQSGQLSLAGRRDMGEWCALLFDRLQDA